MLARIFAILLVIVGLAIAAFALMLHANNQRVDENRAKFTANQPPCPSAWIDKRGHEFVNTLCPNGPVIDERTTK